MPKLAPTITERLNALGLVAMLALCWSLAFPYFEAVRNANERPRIIQSMALVDSGTFAIDGPARRGMELGPDIAKSPVDGHIYPNKPPGASLVGALAYMAARLDASISGEALHLRSLTWWCRLFAGLLPTLVIAVYAARRMATSLGAPAVGFAVMTWAFATPVSSYMRLFYGHQLAAACLFVGTGMVLGAGKSWYRPPIGSSDTPPSWISIAAKPMAWAFAGGCVAGCAVAVEYMAVFAAIPLGLVLLCRFRQPGAWAIACASLAGACLPIGLLARYHSSAFGGPLETGYHHVVNASFAAKHGQGFLGMGLPTWDNFYTHILSPAAGLLWWAPLVVVAIYGLVQLALSRDEWADEARVGLGVFAIITFVGLSLSFDGGWRVGPRYLIVAMPFLILGWAHAFGQFRSEHALVGGVCYLLTYSLFVNTWAASLWPHFDTTNCNSPVVEVLQPLLRFQHAPYGWGHDMQLEPEFAPWLIIGLPLLCTALTFARNVIFGLRMLATLAAAMILGYVTLLTLPKMHTPHPRGEANLRYIRQVYEPKAATSSSARSDGKSRPITEIVRRASP